MGGLIAILAAIGMLVWGYYYMQAEAAQHLLSKIEMSARFSDRCQTAYPIEISIHNGTSKSIDSISFTLVAKRPGFSSDIYSSYRISDRILKPDALYVACWALSQYDLGYAGLKNVPLDSVIWSAIPSWIKYSK